jgi:hypothetical protein
MGQRPVVIGVDDVGGGLTLIGHPHVQRPVAHEGEAALGLIQLHRGHADVEHRAVEAGPSAIREGLGEARERGPHQGKPAGEVVGHGLGVGLYGRVAVQGDDLGPGRQDGAGIAAGAEGGVDHRLAGPGRQGLEHLCDQDGGVGA